MTVMFSIDGYQIRRSLGVGATSEVFEAIRALDQKLVALKVFSPIVTADESVVERLQNEVDVLLKLQHPNVVSLQSSVKAEKQFCLDLELVVGQDLRQWTQNYTLPLIEPCLWVLAQIARGLGAAHEIGVIHRDLKPENVLISDAGDVKITDFGLARQINRLTITRMGLLIGSLGYIAPEVIDGDRVSEQSDIFSFGVIAYELLTKRPPFGAETPQGIIKSVMDGAFTPLGALNSAVPPQIAELVERCLARSPELRPQSIWQVEAALMTYLGSSGIRALCKDLVSMQKRDGAAANALVLKHEMLWKSINNAKSQVAIVPLVLETMSLFPDDSKATELLRTLSESTHRRRRQERGLWGLMALLLLGSVVVYQMLIGPEESHPPEFRASSQTSPMIDAIVSGTTAPSEPSPNSVATRIGAPENNPMAPALPKPSMREQKPGTSPERQTHGFLSFILPEGVNVEVDGLLVPASSILKYQVTTGTHSVRMVKEGFLPIESKVSVRAGQTATINALGAPPKDRAAEEDENE